MISAGSGARGGIHGAGSLPDGRAGGEDSLAALGGFERVNMLRAVVAVLIEHDISASPSR